MRRASYALAMSGVLFCASRLLLCLTGISDGVLLFSVSVFASLLTTLAMNYAGAFVNWAVAGRSNTRRGSVVANPPALRLRRMVRFFTTAKGFREVFEPTFADMDAEYFEALSRKEYFEARKIVIACHLKVGMLLAMRPVVRALATFMGWMKAG